MATASNGSFFAVVAVMFGIMILSIGYMLYSLARQGDERKNLIKTKAMSGTLLAVIGLLILQIAVSIIGDRQLEGLNPLIFLTIISIVFFALLVFNKKRYGG
jgi:uncharacterized membrane protein SirB2